MNQLFGTSCVTSYELKRRQSEIPMVEQNGGALSFNRFFCDSRFCRFCLFPSTYMSPTCIEPWIALRAGLPNGRLEVRSVLRNLQPTCNKVLFQSSSLGYRFEFPSFNFKFWHGLSAYTRDIYRGNFVVYIFGDFYGK